MTCPVTIKDLLGYVFKAGVIIKSEFGKPITVQLKKDQTPVTLIDEKINALAHKWATANGLGFIGEEGSGSADAEYLLVVDPLDGTGAFTIGLPTCTTVASILKRQSNGRYTPIMAVVYNCITDELWTAEVGKGAYRKFGRQRDPVTLSTAAAIIGDKWHVYTCNWPNAGHNMPTIARDLVHHSEMRDYQVYGFAQAGCMVAQGTLSATAISVTRAYETAATSLIVREAGGIVTDLVGQPIISFEVEEVDNKVDILLPRGAILAADAEIWDVYLNHIHASQN